MSLSALTAMAIVSTALMHASDKPYRTETVTYARPDCRALKATLYTPAAPSKGLRPAIVLIHGGAWAAGTRRQVYWYGRHFAAEGYVAMSISYRRLPFSGFPAPVHDAKAAVRWLRAHAAEYRIDPDRIAALGTSAGGHLALMLALTDGEEELEGTENPGYSSAVQAAVSFYGPADLRLYAGENAGESWVSRLIWEPYLKRFAGKEKLAGREPLDAASPLSYVGPDAAPVLCIHGTGDSLVPIDQSRRIYRKLTEAGVPAQCIEVPGEWHAFDYLSPSKRRELFPKVLAFLEAHLGKSGGEGKTPVEEEADVPSR